MEYVVAVYLSRRVSAKVCDFLTKQGFNAALVSTPRGARVGCGLSVKIPRDLPEETSELLAQGETFVGFFLVKNTLGGTVVSKLR